MSRWLLRCASIEKFNPIIVSGENLVPTLQPFMLSTKDAQSPPSLRQTCSQEALCPLSLICNCYRTRRPGRSVRGERANFTRLVLGCIEAKFSCGRLSLPPEPRVPTIRCQLCFCEAQRSRPEEDVLRVAAVDALGRAIKRKREGKSVEPPEIRRPSRLQIRMRVKLELRTFLNLRT